MRTAWGSDAGSQAAVPRPGPAWWVGQVNSWIAVSLNEMDLPKISVEFYGCEHVGSFRPADPLRSKKLRTKFYCIVNSTMMQDAVQSPLIN
jgi:hypothetical protein